jgi:hypothetical protein
MVGARITWGWRRTGVHGGGNDDMRVRANGYTRWTGNSWIELSSFELLIAEQFSEFSEPVKLGNVPKARAVVYCHHDLHCWGARLDSNSRRLYYEHYERSYVIQHDSRFIDHFVSQKGDCHPRSNRNTPMWNISASFNNSSDLLIKSINDILWMDPLFFPLLVYDKSTFRCDGVSAKQCF